MAKAVTSVPTATDYTYRFVRRSLPDGCRDVLEIGCGAGELARRLAEDGLRVVALDSDDHCIADARSRGVDARLARWPMPIAEQFDAVLFTRSLHHISELDEAVHAAASAVQPGGRIIVEDFRAEGGSDRSRRWFIGLALLLKQCGAFRDDFELDPLLADFDAPEPVHDLHSSTAIAAALEQVGQVEAEDSAYYFRYLEPGLSDAVASALLDHELSLIEAGAIDPLGKRFVVTPAA